MPHPCPIGGDECRCDSPECSHVCPPFNDRDIDDMGVDDDFEDDDEDAGDDFDDDDDEEDAGGEPRRDFLGDLRKLLG